MGLLDFSGFVGDDTAKDEFGMTQADRRQPLFTGLLKAGMLGMAAGENITPGQRAQLMGQVGGAITDIPEAMNRNRAEAAQMQLRRQQFTAGQAKLDQAKKIQAYAQTPEFAEMVKGLPQHIQLGLKVAIDAGDVEHFTRLMGTVESHRNDRTGIPTGWERDPANPAAIRKIPGWKADEDHGLWKGNNPDLQMLDVLAKGKVDPAVAASEAYRQAHERMGKERQTVVNGQVVTSPAMNLSTYPDPTSPAAPGSPASKPKEAPPPVGEPRTNPDASVTTTAVDGSYKTEFTDGSVKQYDKNGTLLREIQAKPPDAADVRDFNKFEADASTTVAALDDFRDEARRATREDKAKSLAGVPTALRQAHTLAGLLTKGDVLLNLGVLTGEDMELIRSILPDPSTFKGTFGDYAGGVEKARKLIAHKLALRERQVYPHGRPGAKPGTGGGGAPPGALPTVTTKEAYDKLPPGAKFVGQDGQQYVKP